MKRILFITLLLAAYLPSRAQVYVSAVLDSAAMLIGDQTTLHINANHPGNVSLDFPLLQLGSFEMIEMGEIDTLKKGAETILQQDIIITAFDSGYYQIPPQRFLIRNNGNTDTVYSSPVGMRVHLVEQDSANQIAPIETIKAQPFTKEEMLNYLIGVGVIAFVFGLLFFIFTRKKKKIVVEAPKVVIPAHIIAMKKIEELKKAKLWQAGELKKYYSQLTFIVREYLENRYEILALESTTDEILTDLKQQDLSDALKQKLREVLQSADLVKFAKAAPSAEFHENSMKVAEDFISQTKKVIDLTKASEEASN